MARDRARPSPIFPASSFKFRCHPKRDACNVRDDAGWPSRVRPGSSSISCSGRPAAGCSAYPPRSLVSAAARLTATLERHRRDQTVWNMRKTGTEWAPNHAEWSSQSKRATVPFPRGYELASRESSKKNSTDNSPTLRNELYARAKQFTGKNTRERHQVN